MENMKTEETKKQLKILFGKLTKDSNSLFYSVEKINRNLLNKAQKSVYKEFFTNFIMKLKIMILFLMKKAKKYLSACRLLSKKGLDRSSTLYSIKAPFELFHADIANIKFLSKSAADPHYCLLCVNLFSSKIYTYPMKKRSLLAKKK